MPRHADPDAGGRGGSARQGRRSRGRRGIAAARARRSRPRCPRRHSGLRLDRLAQVRARAGRAVSRPHPRRRTARRGLADRVGRDSRVSRHRPADPSGPLDLRAHDRGGRPEVRVLLARGPLVGGGAVLEARRGARARLAHGNGGLVARDRRPREPVLPRRRVGLHDPQPALRGAGRGRRPGRLQDPAPRRGPDPSRSRSATR